MSITTADIRTGYAGDAAQIGPFILVSVPVTWLLLAVPALTDLPVMPFILLGVLVGSVVPAVVIMRRDPTSTGRAAFEDCFRLPRPLWLIVLATAALPVTTWTLGGPHHLSGDDIGALLIVNLIPLVFLMFLWDELVWTGFVQRRAIGAWGPLAGVVATAALWTLVRLPLVTLTPTGRNHMMLAAALLVAATGLRMLLAALDLWGGGSIFVLAVGHASLSISIFEVVADDVWAPSTAALLVGSAAYYSGFVRPFRVRRLARVRATT